MVNFVKYTFNLLNTMFHISDICLGDANKKNRVTLSRQPGYLAEFETRGFPSPVHAGFGFI